MQSRKIVCPSKCPSVHLDAGIRVYLDTRGADMALTDTALKALKPRERTYTLADDRGLYVEVFPTGGVV